MIIAIDGPAASGKGTLARRIAEHFNLPHLDSGLLYRATARDVLAAGKDLRNSADAEAAAHNIDPATLQDERLRHRGIGEAASIVAKFPGVRAALSDFQHAFAHQPGGAVIDGRDIGTVVCPEADVKIFVVADVEERARRRFLELEARGEPVTREGVLLTIRQRDERDRTRTESPMRAADDAELLDTTNLDIETAVAAALQLIKRKIDRPDPA
ncbi:MAG: (d)CMP kinase [Pseudomonadota bacterium]